MRSFKRALLAVLAFLLCAALLSVLLLLPLMTGRSGYDDSRRRRELAGQIDLLISGASYGANGLVPDIIDEAYGCTSYNLSSFRSSMEGRYALLEQELERNPVRTVVMEISADSFSRDPAGEHGKGEATTIARLDGYGRKFAYAFDTLSLADSGYDNVYSMLLGYGVHGWIGMLRGSSDGVAENRGWWSFPASDVSLSAEQAAADYGREGIENTWYPALTEKFVEIAGLCAQHDAELLVVVTPLSDGQLWCTAGLDDFRAQLLALCQENGCDCLDFNLYRDRGSCLSDARSYMDRSHLSSEGAAAFSRIFGETLAAREMGDVSALFYASYAEALAHSPYAAANA